MSDNPFTERLLNSIEQLPQQVYKFTKLKEATPQMFSLKAVDLGFTIEGTRHCEWVGFSNLRKDNNNEIWMASWLYNKIKEDKNDD